MNNTILILGYGQIGKAVKVGLPLLGLSPDFGVNVLSVDKENTDAKLIIDVRNLDAIESILETHKPKLVISCLPYHLNGPLACLTLAKRIHYCDLGGSNWISEFINSAAKNAQSTCFTDLGLAPGWVNIEAWNQFKAKQEEYEEVKSVVMYCGGLPHPKHKHIYSPLYYKPTWSMEGLYNEYKEDAKVINDGVACTFPSMSDVEEFNDELEAFNTSGGLAHSLDMFKTHIVNYVAYKTLRYKGHWDWLYYFLKKCNFSYTEFTKLFRGLPERFNDDVVYLAVKINDSIVWSREVSHTENLSAMQRGTAFPLCAVARQIFDDELPRGKCDYTHVKYDEFSRDLTKLGL